MEVFFRRRSLISEIKTVKTTKIQILKPNFFFILQRRVMRERKILKNSKGADFFVKKCNSFCTQTQFLSRDPIKNVQIERFSVHPRFEKD